MGITIRGMMVVGETGDNLVGVYEGFENLDEEYEMECCPEYYDADPENCVYGFKVDNVEVEDMNEAWRLHIKNLADEFYDITGVKARLIGCQIVY